jgi:hypothetical protein
MSRLPNFRLDDPRSPTAAPTPSPAIPFNLSTTSTSPLSVSPSSLARRPMNFTNRRLSTSLSSPVPASGLGSNSSGIPVFAASNFPSSSSPPMPSRSPQGHRAGAVGSGAAPFNFSGFGGFAGPGSGGGSGAGSPRPGSSGLATGGAGGRNRFRGEGVGTGSPSRLGLGVGVGMGSAGASPVEMSTREWTFFVRWRRLHCLRQTHIILSLSPILFCTRESTLPSRTSRHSR